MKRASYIKYLCLLMVWDIKSMSISIWYLQFLSRSDLLLPEYCQSRQAVFVKNNIKSKLPEEWLKNWVQIEEHEKLFQYYRCPALQFFSSSCPVTTSQPSSIFGTGKEGNGSCSVQKISSQGILVCTPPHLRTRTVEDFQCSETKAHAYNNYAVETHRHLLPDILQKTILENAGSMLGSVLHSAYQNGLQSQKTEFKIGLHYL